MSPADFRGPLFMDGLLSCLQDTNICSAFPQYSSSDAPTLTLSNDASTRSVDGPFSISMSFCYPSKESDQDFPTVIDTFTPKPFAHNLSPPSSTSSEWGSTSLPHTSNQRTVLDAFNATRSCIVQVSGTYAIIANNLDTNYWPVHLLALFQQRSVVRAVVGCYLLSNVTVVEGDGSSTCFLHWCTVWYAHLVLL